MSMSLIDRETLTKNVVFFVISLACPQSWLLFRLVSLLVYDQNFYGWGGRGGGLGGG